MKEYRLGSFISEIDWSIIKRDYLTECIWSPNEAPPVNVMGAHNEEVGIIIRMENFSSPTRAKHFSNEALVCEDDCLECFVSMPDGRYFNVEVNSNGATRMRVGHNRYDRVPLITVASQLLPLTSAFKTLCSWGVEITLPTRFLIEFCGISLTKGTEIKANFYSCADKSMYPYYSAWNPVDTLTPDFHRPEYFGRIVLE